MAENKESIDEKRRTLIKGIIGASIITTILGVGSVANYLNPSATQVGPKYPRVKIANIKELKNGSFIRFCYPLTSEVNLLIKVGEKVENGIGPDQDIVAFSAICQHLGCIINQYYPNTEPFYNKYQKVMVCPCHLSVYDVTHDARVLAGPAPRRLPRVILEYDEATGDIYAVGMEGPVILGKGPAGLEGTDLPNNLRPGFLGGEIVNDNTARTCGEQS
jgi:arsenite oxidase small subunit